MSIELTKKYSDKVDDLFNQESKTSLLTNSDYDWSGAHSVVVYKASTVPLNDYKRNSNGVNDSDISRFGKIQDLSLETEEMLLKHDKSFIFNIDKLDEEETALEAEERLAREISDVVIPTLDQCVYKAMVDNSGTKAEAIELTSSNIYEKILDGSAVLDENLVPDTERSLVVTPQVYALLKKSVVFDNVDVGVELRQRGVIGILDGMNVIKVPSSRLPEKFGFMLSHPQACTAPVKLEDYGTYDDQPLTSGTLVTGRICYDAFVLDNKKKGIYYQPVI